MGIQTPIRIEASIILIFKVWIQCQQWLHLSTENQIRKNYRKYKIKTVKGPDDYKSMREVVRRRYSRVLNEGLPLPDLIIVDGGKGHMNGVIDVLQNELGLISLLQVCRKMINTKHLNYYMALVQKLYH